MIRTFNAAPLSLLVFAACQHPSSTTDRPTLVASDSLPTQQNQTQVTASDLPDTCVLAKDLELEGDVSIGSACPRFVLAAGVTLTVRGASRVDVAPSLIEVAGHGKATIRALGSKGDGGDPGADGSDYDPKKPPGVWTSTTSGQYWTARDDAESNEKNRCRGQKGLPGKRGLPGATVNFPNTPRVTGTLTVETLGGLGGEGGPGGHGNEIRNGEGFTCPGCIYGCASGLRGDLGIQGEHGKIVVNGQLRAIRSFTFFGGDAP